MKMNNNFQIRYTPPAESQIVEIDRFQIEIVKPYNKLQYCLSQTEVDRIINKSGNSNLEYQLKSQNLWQSDLPQSLTAIKPFSPTRRKKMVRIRPIPLEMAWQYWVLQANYGRTEAQELIVILGEKGDIKIRELADKAFNIKAEVTAQQLNSLPSYISQKEDILQETLNHIQNINYLLSKVVKNINHYTSLSSN